MQNIFEYMYEQHYKKGIVPTLDRLKVIYDLYNLNLPKEKIIHITGTNGKGSVTALLKSILEENNKRVGVFTSPHIYDITERFYADGKLIDKKELENILIDLKKKVDEYQNEHPYHFITFFEYMTMAAFIWFDKLNLDYIILEVGMGGLYDATNLIETSFGAITSIALEHTSYLGDTIEKIAFQKAGIVKQNQTMVIGFMDYNAKNVIYEQCKLKNAKYIDVFESQNYKNMQEMPDYFLYNNKEIDFSKRNLKGAYQRSNCRVATALAFEILPNITVETIESGIKKAYWEGRYELISEKPLIIKDVAHNPEGINVLKQSILSDYPNYYKRAIFGVMADKNYKEMIEMLSEFVNEIIFCLPETERAANPEDLTNCTNLPSKVISNPVEALKYAKEITTKENEMIIITGSIYLMESFGKNLNVLMKI